jgi:uncharacterized protein YdeI (YjbR/CyaY-like superfamily)
MPSKIHPHASQLITESFDTLPAWSREICIKLRQIIHTAIPDIIEDWKWGPNFRNTKGMVAGVWGMQKFVSFIFYEGANLKDPKKLFAPDTQQNQHNRRIRLTSLEQIDEPTFIAYLQEADHLQPTQLKRTKKELVIPQDLSQAFTHNPVAQQNFTHLPYSHQKEYLEWIETAKRPQTRQTRIQKTIDQVAQNIGLNDKYR